MKKIVFIAIILCWVSVAQAGFLSYSTMHRNTLMSGECTFLDPKDGYEPIATGNITIFLEEGQIHIQVSGDKRGYDFHIVMPVRYTNIDSEQMTTPSGTEFTLFSMIYGSTKVGFVNEGVSYFAIKYNGRLYNLNAYLKFYTLDWDLIKKDNGGSLRTGDEVENWLHGLMMDKRFGQI